MNTKRLTTTPGYWYLASPYSQYPKGIEQAFADVCVAAAWLVRKGVRIFCPIAHSHPLSLAGNIDPCDYETWMELDSPLIGAAFGLIVLELPTWDTSRGVAEEITRFTQDGKPIVHMGWPLLEVRTLSDISERLAERIGVSGESVVAADNGKAIIGDSPKHAGWDMDRIEDARGAESMLKVRLTETQLDIIASAVNAILSQTSLGAEKYDPDQWRDETIERHVRRAVKHAMTFLEIQDEDREDDGENHMSAAVCRMAMAMAIILK